MEHVIDKKYILEVLVKKNQIRLEKNFYAFLAKFNIDSIYMDGVRMSLSLPHPKEIKNPERANKLKNDHDYVIKFSKHIDLEKFLYLYNKEY